MVAHHMGLGTIQKQEDNPCLEDTNYKDRQAVQGEHI